MKEAKNPVKSVRTTISILSALEDADGSRISELASRVETTKGTVHNHLATLREEGYVVKRGDQYYLGSRLVRFGAAVRERSPLYRRSEGELQSLAQSTGESACIAVEEEGYVVYQRIVPELSETQRLITEGDRMPLHCSALGKCLLAGYSNDEIRSYLEWCNENGLSERAIDDGDELVGEIKTVREQNLAFSRGEYDEDLYEVATSVQIGSTGARGAVGVFGPKERMSGKSLQQDTAGLVLNAAKRIEVAIHRSGV